MADWLDILNDIRKGNRIAQPEPSSEAVFTNAAYEDTACASCNDAESLEEAEYEGHTVTLNKPFRTPDGPKKFAVYVQNEKGNVIKLGFGDLSMEIKRDDPDRRKAYRDRHNCDNPGPKWKAEYWSCRMWSSKPVSKIAEAVPSLEVRIIGESTSAPPAILIAVPKHPHDGDGKGFWKIGNDVYRASVKGGMDTHGLPMDKRWESSYEHFVRYWPAVHATHYMKTKEWKTS